MSAPFLFTMTERLNIFEAPNLVNADGGEENDHVDDGVLFFGCKTTPSHALFFLYHCWYDPRFIPYPMTMKTSDHGLLFILFPMNAARGLAKTVRALNRRQTNSPFSLVLDFILRKETGHVLHQI